MYKEDFGVKKQGLTVVLLLLSCTKYSRVECVSLPLSGVFVCVESLMQSCLCAKQKRKEEGNKKVVNGRV